MEQELPSAITNGVYITAESKFIPEQSSDKHATFVFAYQISIENQSSDAIQLLRRHWDIVDTYIDKKTVDGDGVIGKQPVLGPGESHSYASGAVIKTPMGKMSGHYIMLNLDTNEEFEVRIPEFSLQMPHLLN